MKSRYQGGLALTERAVAALAVLNALYGVGILMLLMASLVAPEFVVKALVGKTAQHVDGAVRGVRLLMLVGLAAVPVTHFILGRLRSMLATVRDGDPFVALNARRLNEIAIALLVLELLHVVVAFIVRGDALIEAGLHIDWSFSFTPWLAVLLLFVLARIFEHGASMRADLEGTV